jgi:hypothetical protein
MSPDKLSTARVMAPQYLGVEDIFCEGALVSTDMLSRAVSDCYHCLETFLDFALCGKLSLGEGFFRFGSNITCYGPTCSGVRNARVGLPAKATQSRWL